LNETLRAWQVRFSQLWGKYNAVQRRNIAIAISAALVCFVVILWMFLRPHFVTVLSGLDNKSIGAVQTELDTLKIPNQIQGSSVLVPSSQADTARVQLAMAGLPKSGYIGYSATMTNSLGETQDQFNIQVLDALQQSLDQTINSIDGIESAQVHIVMPGQQLFMVQSTNPAKASVFVQLGTGVQLAGAQVAGIQQLVSHSVKGLAASDVSVTDQNGVDLTKSLSANSNGVSGTVGNSEIADRQQLEQAMTDKLMNSLQSIVGAGNVQVVVHSNVTFNQSKTTQHSVIPANGSSTGLPTSTQIIKKTSTNGSGLLGGIAGSSSTNPNLPTYTGSSGTGAANSTDTETTNNYENGYKNSTVVSDPIQYNGYTVGVLLNANDKSITPVILKQIQTFVANSVGVSGGSNNNISVTSMPFQGAIGLGMGTNRSNLLYWIGAGVIALGGGWFLISFLRRKRRIVPELVSQSFEGESEDLGSYVPTEDERMREQIVKLANHKPEDFTNLLRTWIAGE